jgi:hypothetical protein
VPDASTFTAFNTKADANAAARMTAESPAAFSGPSDSLDERNRSRRATADLRVWIGRYSLHPKGKVEAPDLAEPGWIRPFRRLEAKHSRGNVPESAGFKARVEIGHNDTLAYSLRG